MNKYFFTLLTLLSFQAYGSSWDGTVTGEIRKLDVVVNDGNNAGFRIELVNNPALCGNEQTWAYINKSDENYQVAVSVLLAAKMAKNPVSLYTKKNTSWNDYCHVGYVVLR
ncbi:MAG: hypothetical protein K6L76_13530 [Agarilytica sp.]